MQPSPTDATGTRASRTSAPVAAGSTRLIFTWNSRVATSITAISRGELGSPVVAGRGIPGLAHRFEGVPFSLWEGAPEVKTR